ncbi:hypothetical protein [Elizabethkingia phage TCUEAP1]|nr:hypothetical protein [Elizabethkingia phage TCUEAP1]
MAIKIKDNEQTPTFEVGELVACKISGGVWITSLHNVGINMDKVRCYCLDGEGADYHTGAIIDLEKDHLIKWNGTIEIKN